MVQNSSWEANWFAASQEMPRISRNPKVHYRTHKRPPPVSILGQPNPVHIPTCHLLEIHPNIIHPSTPRSPQWSPSLRFPHQDPIHPPLLTHTLHMPSPSHSSRFYHPHNIGWEVQTIHIIIIIIIIITLCSSSPPPPHHHLHLFQHHHHYCYHNVLWALLVRKQIGFAERTEWQSWFMLGHVRPELLDTRSDM